MRSSSGRSAADLTGDDVRRKEAPRHVHRRSDVGETLAVAALTNEERNGHLVVVSEVVVAVVDARDAEQAAAGKDLGDLELWAGKQSLGRTRADQPGSGGGARISNDAGHGDGAPLNQIVCRHVLHQARHATSIGL